VVVLAVVLAAVLAAVLVSVPVLEVYFVSYPRCDLSSTL